MINCSNQVLDACNQLEKAIATDPSLQGVTVTPLFNQKESRAHYQKFISGKSHNLKLKLEFRVDFSEEIMLMESKDSGICFDNLEC